MSGANNDEPEHLAQDRHGPILESVHQAVLSILASLPERPKRVRVRAAQVSVDLDWRQHPGPPSAAHPVHLEQANNGAAAAVTGDQRPPVNADSPATSWFISAPAVGTFYHAPEPGKPPFVVPGVQVEVGQQVGIIEAMKLMLPVEADHAGQVIKILVDDGQAVQYGEHLIEVGPVDSEQW
jgi:acetyl-CoA carboxylase biotin carboxyl carrier protein